MQYFEEEIDVKEIDTLTMYKMIYQLLKSDFYYEAKCLVNIFIEKRTDTKELEILNEVRDLIYEYRIEEAKQYIKNI